MTEPKYMVSYFKPGTYIDDAAEACIETAKLNNCTVLMCFQGYYIPVTQKMTWLSVRVLRDYLLQYKC